ncbi:glycoside hydrolase family 16 protein [Arthrobacter burdickii]|uniref:Glycoside hydrolase family 16 protein n=1 Tax=Arthrobacter burdickii TaxID=3035920 RepID=A0ABT8K8G1_9MICC|nr:glycoside hydrolase family 16 protein [Arthrobacter burdickii]MDN4612614.1 glycoside hydrolase family 16 protein [Arthrobacter burdickii]
MASWTALDYGGNRDLGEQHYNDPSMVSLEGGNLVLKARKSPRDGFEYLAGSISSKGKVALGPHGRLTTRQYISPGDGIGVGVCLYGSNIDEVGWPACGEIDATEIAVARGESPFASIHGPGYSGGSPISATRQGDTLIGRWAEHTLEWEPDRISWAIDGETYHVAEATNPRAVNGWPFEQPFFVTIVMTVGSGLSGPVDESTWPLSEQGMKEDPYAVFEFIRFEQKDQEGQEHP